MRWPFTSRNRPTPIDQPGDDEDQDVLGPLGLNSRSIQNITVLADIKRDVEDIKTAVQQIANVLAPDDGTGGV